VEIGMIRPDLKRDVFKRRRSPILDPITAALLGYTRRGTGWVKHQNRNS